MCFGANFLSAATWGLPVGWLGSFPSLSLRLNASIHGVWTRAAVSARNTPSVRRAWTALKARRLSLGPARSTGAGARATNTFILSRDWPIAEPRQRRFNACPVFRPNFFQRRSSVPIDTFAVNKLSLAQSRPRSRLSGVAYQSLPYLLA